MTKDNNKTVISRKGVKVAGRRKMISKTWAAVLKNKNNPGIEIADMRAVLK